MDNRQAQFAVQARQRLADERTRLPLRLRAAGWAAAAAAIPAIIAASYVTGPSWGDLVPIPLIDLILMTLLSAALSGFLFAWRLLDQGRPYGGSTAAVLGVITALLAYIILADVFLVAILLLPARYGGAGDYTLGGLLVFLVVWPFFFLFWGVALTGWYTLLAAGLAGFLLNDRKYF